MGIKPRDNLSQRSIKQVLFTSQLVTIITGDIIYIQKYVRHTDIIAVVWEGRQR
jgi:hypothetical protein